MVTKTGNKDKLLRMIQFSSNFLNRSKPGSHIFWALQVYFAPFSWCNCVFSSQWHVSSFSLFLMLLSFQSPSSVFYQTSTPSIPKNWRPSSFKKFSLQNHNFWLIVENSIYLSRGIQILCESRNFQYIPQICLFCPAHLSQRFIHIHFLDFEYWDSLCDKCNNHHLLERNF